MGNGRKTVGAPNSFVRATTLATHVRRPVLARVPTHEDMIERLRTSLHAATPSPDGYRPSPPSSAASSCGTWEADDDMGSDDVPLGLPVSTEWEAWVNWDRIDEIAHLPSIDGMRIED